MARRDDIGGHTKEVTSKEKRIYQGPEFAKLPRVREIQGVTHRDASRVVLHSSEKVHGSRGIKMIIP